MATHKVTKKGKLFDNLREFCDEFSDCGIPGTYERAVQNLESVLEKAGGSSTHGASTGGKMFSVTDGELELVTESKVETRKVKQTLTELEGKSKKSKSAKLKKLLQGIFQKKSKEDKKKQIEMEVPVYVVAATLRAEAAGPAGSDGVSGTVLKFSVDKSEAEKMIEKGLAKEP